MWVALLTIALRLPSLIEPHHYGDEGVFAAVAHALLHGRALYLGAWDDKPPGVYWLYAGVMAVAGPSMTAIHAVVTVWCAGTAVSVTLLGRRLLGRRRGVAAGVLFALLASSPLLEANLALTELFAAAPLAVAFCLLLRDAPAGRGRPLLVGGLLAVAFLFKQIAGLEAAAAVLWLAGRRRQGLVAALWLCLGWVGTVSTALAILAAQGAFTAALYAVMGFYGVYLREGSASSGLATLIKLAPPAVALGLAAMHARRTPLAPRDGLLLWLGFATLGATAGARPFGHYLLLTLAPLALAGVAVVGPPRRLRTARGPLTLLAVCLLSLSVSFSDFWLSYGGVRPGYYAHVARRLTGREDRAAFDGFFSWRVADQERIAPIIRTDHERTLYVWGEYPWLYPLADATNPTRFSVSYLTSFVPGAKDEVLTELRAHPPRYIVAERQEWRRLPGLRALLTERYEPVLSVDGADLYRRRE